MRYLASFQLAAHMEFCPELYDNIAYLKYDKRCKLPQPKKLSETLYSESIDLATSIKVLFFLSITPFYSGVYLDENSCLIPLSVHNSSTLVFLNSLPLQLLTFFTLRSNSFSALAIFFQNIISIGLII